MPIKIAAASRLTTAGPLDTALKMFVQAVVDEDATTRFTSGDSPVAEIKSSSEEIPVLVLDASSAKAIASLLARHKDATVEIRATGAGKIEVDFIVED